MKKSSLFFFFQLLIFWLLIFQLGRAIFITYQWVYLSKNTFSEILLSFYHGFKMDLSVAAYLLVLPYLIMAISQWFRQQQWMLLIIKYYTAFLLFCYAVIVSVELELFVEWETKLNYKALTYLQHPTEVVSVSSNSVIFTVILLTAFILLVAHHLYKKISPAEGLNSSRMHKVLFTILAPCFIIPAARGGFQEVPINQSSVYYTNSNTLNNASVNSMWNLLFSVVNHRKDFSVNPYVFFSEEEMDKNLNGIYPELKSKTPLIFKHSRPNIALIILEGWSSDLIETLGGFSGVTPNLNQISGKGLLFTNIYASGLRSNEGIASILSGLPAIPEGAITQDPSKYKNIPVMSKELKAAGYNTLYGFGGELEYGNLKGYLIQADFDKLIEGKDFDSQIPRAKLGVHDEYAFSRYLQEMDQLKPPFFASWFTVSSHAPYDIPVEYSIDVNGLDLGYVNSVHYADQQLGVFFENARKKPWYDNTVFILISDHGHSSPKRRPFYDPDYRKIPLILYGNPIKNEYRGKRVDMIGSQTDLVATLFRQLNLGHSHYHYSKDLLNEESQPFAYYAFDDGFGWKEDSFGFSYHILLKEYLWSNLPNDSLKERFFNKGASYLQQSYQEYVDY